MGQGDVTGIFLSDCTNVAGHNDLAADGAEQGKTRNFTGEPITITREGSLDETVTLPFNYEYFLHPSKALTKTMSHYGDELDKKNITYDYTEFRNEAGVVKSKESWFSTEGHVEVPDVCGFVPLTISGPRDKTFAFDINFYDYSPDPVPASYKANSLYKYASMMYGQNKDGVEVKFPDEFPGSLIYMVIYHDYTITE